MPTMLPIPERVSSISASSGELSSHLSRRNTSSRVNLLSETPNHDSQLRSETFLARINKRNPQESHLPQPEEGEYYRDGNGDGINAADSIKGGYLTERELSQRASSPLLGQTYKRNHHAGLSSFHAIPKPLRPSESSSTLRSIYDHPSSLPSYKTSASSHSDVSLRNNFQTFTQPAPDMMTGHDINAGQKERRKSLKAKRRPPMIDLSKLFPRPRDTAVSLLSPHRLTTSPSPVSLHSDASATKPSKINRIYNGNKLTKRPRARDAAEMRLRLRKEKLQREEQEHEQDQGYYGERQRLYQDQRREFQPEITLGPTLSQRRKYDGWRDPTKYRHRTGPDWFDGPEGQVSDDDEDSVIGEQEAQNTVPAMLAALQEVSRPRHSSFSSGGPSLYRSNLSRSSSQIMPASSNSSTIKRAPSSQDLSSGHVYHPTPMLDGNPTGSQPGRNAIPANRGPTKSQNGGAVMRRPSKLSLNSKNLNESSMLCLSSSEDDEDEDDREDATSSYVNRTVLRDSIATLDEGAEICTAQAIETRSHFSIKRVPTGHSVRTRTTRSTAPTSQNNSAASSVISSNRSRSGSVSWSSQIPSISEPATSPSLHPSTAQSLDSRRPGSKSQSNKQNAPPSNRRSRFMAVTRQEEYLLELIRRNKGSIPTNLFTEAELSGPEPEGKVHHAHRPTSAYNSDVSFLKLSPGIPPRGKPRFHADTSTLSDGGSLAVSDPGDALTEHSGASPRTSLVHSDTFSSPSTGLGSPLTPTLPTIQRLPSRKSHRSQFPTAIQEERRHSRTRTDSSSAIVFDGDENGGNDTEQSVDLPIWALGWSNNEPSNVAVVH
ncbi:hypothetical protein CPC735_048010 [Coccidioides posadasii C735 delta SOWgp]|uniref:Uncharacterized protein n=1 Tax=Coccidioides posadasii (strain C735) TaxID=222929 RepID=C5PFX8_COCP7|nr:hypothetical protein CPC735_048010 [Coccidioides posadasii C735 delta SOWgp]EER23431.1 hypothetical protein CPC735_048010 [Coccidioides posadasii C735 delta SOWgp]|eukprot:XP_003065576.1 hypothetical protein CPC735_048010 [Coccidioides posadasii C735 delta SOWgp]